MRVTLSPLSNVISFVGHSVKQCIIKINIKYLHCQRLFNKLRCFFGYSLGVAKTAFLGMRISPELRKQLQQIAQREERSISQICEVFLRGGAAAYQTEGAKYLERILAKRKGQTEQ